MHIQIRTINLIEVWSKISADRMSRCRCERMCFGIFEIYVRIHVNIDSSLQSVFNMHAHPLNRSEIQKSIQ